MAILLGYFDESGKHRDHPVVAFCGVCASPSRVQQFDEAWNSLLRLHGLASFHASQAFRTSRKLSDSIPEQTPPERIEALKPFADCINDHLELGLAGAWDVKGYNILKAKLGNPDDPYYVAFTRGVLAIAEYTHDGDRIGLICDDDTETAWSCYLHYRKIRQVDARMRKKIVSLGFADDNYFPALQAADMLAALTRLEARRQFYRDHYTFHPLFNHLIKERGPSKMQWKVMFADERKLRDAAKSLSGNIAPRKVT